MLLVFVAYPLIKLLIPPRSLASVLPAFRIFLLRTTHCFVKLNQSFGNLAITIGVCEQGLYDLSKPVEIPVSFCWEFDKFKSVDHMISYTAMRIATRFITGPFNGGPDSIAAIKNSKLFMEGPVKRGLDDTSIVLGWQQKTSQRHQFQHLLCRSD